MLYYTYYMKVYQGHGSLRCYTPHTISNNIKDLEVHDVIFHTIYARLYHRHRGLRCYYKHLRIRRYDKAQPHAAMMYTCDGTF